MVGGGRGGVGGGAAPRDVLRAVAELAVCVQLLLLLLLLAGGRAGTARTHLQRVLPLLLLRWQAGPAWWTCASARRLCAQHCAGTCRGRH